MRNSATRSLRLAASRQYTSRLAPDVVLFAFAGTVSTDETIDLKNSGNKPLSDAMLVVATVAVMALVL